MNLMLGDCLERMKEIPDGSVDMILADPPYGTTACKWDSIIDLPLMWEQLKRIIKPNGAIVMTASQPFTSVLVTSNIKHFKHEWIWKKNAGSNFGALKYQPMKEHESVIIFCNERVNYYPIKQERSESGKAMVKTGVKSKASKGNDVYGGLNQGYDNSKNDKNMRVPSSVQLFNRERGLHPTQKPVALMEYLIKTYTNESETVLDFTMGSGSTGVAAKNLNRDFIGIEMDEGYFNIAQDRIENA
mgnify:FL=1|tara:strand:- start:47 stop:778 length:732 start_codon:yes stop_codon:yes gene_type:complete